MMDRMNGMDRESTSSFFSIQQRQRAALQEMIASSGQRDNGGMMSFGAEDDPGEIWKVLIYDTLGREIIAPLLSVADLRGLGVTLHLLLSTPRQPIPDVPAVYFVAPTQGNVRRIIDDVRKGLYEEFCIYFTSVLPRTLMEELAEGIVKGGGKVGKVAKVYDMYTELKSLEDDLFILDRKGCYERFNAPGTKDVEVQEEVDKVVNGLFCAVSTLGAVPVIRAQKGGPAELVASILEKRIREALVARHNVFSDSPLRGERPLLVILDRGLDLGVMLHHTWTYQALTHDSLGMKLNRVTIPVREGEQAALSGQLNNRTFDLDKKDTFWAANAGLPFPMVAEAVETALQQYKDEVTKINRSAGLVGEEDLNQLISASNKADADGAGRLAAAIASIPELRKRKRMIDLHTNIATALLDQIKERGLDGMFQVEEELLSQPDSFDVQRVLAILRERRGSATDKLRLFLIYFLCVPSISDQDIKTCKVALEQAGCRDLRAFEYVKSIKSLTSNITKSSLKMSRSSSGLNDSLNSGYAAVIGSLTQVANNVNKLILSENKALASAKVVEALMDQKGTPEILDAHSIFDPKGSRRGGPSPAAKGKFREAILFMVGGGSYIEYQNVKDHVCKITKTGEGGKSKQISTGKTVIYGSTELCTGEDFLRVMQRLGGPDPGDAPLNGLKTATR